jgi:lipoyl-dependent peroxiredoxin subunit D
MRIRLPEAARDVKLNLQAVLGESSLSPAQRWGVAVAAAATARNRRLLESVCADALREAEPAVIDDALAAAAPMRCTNKADLELFSLAASAINGCQVCIQAHDRAVLEAGLTEDTVHDAVRIAAVVQAAAVALALGSAAVTTGP